jgi:hypothetical protein
MPTELEKEFDTAMINIYKKAKEETGYNAKIFIQMVATDGGLITAKRLINSNTISDGYTALWERNRLDLTVEAMVLETEKYHSLFTPQELEICRNRLAQYNY